MILECIFWIAFFSLVYTYVLYPLMAIIAGSGRMERGCEHLPPVSMLVPAHNEAEVIAAKIENFLALDYPSELIELVICDDGSSDRTVEVVKQCQTERIRLIEVSERGGKAAAMNQLVDAARHPLFLFSDANVMLARNAVRRIVDPLGDKQVGAVTGEVTLVGSDQAFGSGESLYYWMERRIQSAESRIGSVMGVDGGMYLVRRELFQPLPADTILDDFLLSMNVIRAGHRIIYDSAAKATESGTPTARLEFNRRVRIAAGAVQLIKRGGVPRWYQCMAWFKFISHKLLRWLTPVLMAALLVSNMAIATRNGLYQITLYAQLAAYGLMLAAAAWERFRTTRLGGIAFYFALSQAAILIGLWRGLFNLQPPQWEKLAR